MYKAQQSDELDLEVGDVLFVLPTEEEEGWFRGILRGKVGLFPANVRPDYMLVMAVCGRHQGGGGGESACQTAVGRQGFRAPHVSHD